MKFEHSVIVAAMLLAIAPAQAAETEQHLLRCAVLGDSSARLGCFDALSKQVEKASTAKPATPAAPAESAAIATIAAPAAPAAPAEAVVAAAPEKKVMKPDTPISRMSQEWELNTAAKRGRYAVHQLLDNYLLVANQSNATNDRPFRTFLPEGYKSKHVELTYQLSFKAKLIESIADTPIDIWAGYTQKSFWQAYARRESSPFRETNYQPEVMAVMPINKNIGNASVRFASVGFVHQSNGQSSSLSRSWNRFYAQLGMESGDLGVTARVWKRLDNAKSNNDNADITDFMGHGDVRITYRDKGYEYSAMLRRNFDTRHGAVQASVAFPLVVNLKGYVQVFTGYGQSLIDYNYAQKSIGVGVLMDF
ncbi:phospholipase A [Massilia sp. TWR1-2-2]|uniref:phospholipase A n=1 Tax=Massilia sp. TWR1-2-2 TaxID=2804584 RepID=UPI003CF4D4C3